VYKTVSKCALYLGVAAASLASTCGDNLVSSTSKITRIPSLRVVPNIFFQADPEFDSDKKIEELKLNTSEPFLSDTFLISGPAYRFHAGMGIINDGSGDIENVVLVVFIRDPAVFVIGSIGGSIFLGNTFLFNQSPAMIDKNEPVFGGDYLNPDPYPGYVGYVALGPLRAGDGLVFDVKMGVGPGTLMHFEAVGFINENTWAVPVGAVHLEGNNPVSGTSVRIASPELNSKVERYFEIPAVQVGEPSKSVVETLQKTRAVSE